ncbi:hypothetical protein [Lysinibacillus sphaericus]|nr:hypothetical protein [Lysinibacillus sphaericus]
MAFEYLAQYITFDSVADMDESVEDHMEVHYYDLRNQNEQSYLNLHHTA